MNTIEIRTDYMRALLEAAPKKELRSYLNGAHFECGGFGIIGVATDGHCMLVVRVSDAPTAPATLFAPSLWKVSTKASTVTLENSTPDNDGNTLATLNYPGGQLSWTGEVGRFPDWRRVIPDTGDGAPAYIDSGAFAPLVRAAKVLGHKVGPSPRTNGLRAALVTFADPDAFGVIMPCRRDLIEAPPAWAKAPEAVQEAA